MKVVEYTCDNSDCNKKSDSIDGWIMIGSEDGSSLRIENNLPDRIIMKKGMHSDIHFCSGYCLISAFVDKIKIQNVEKFL